MPPPVFAPAPTAVVPVPVVPAPVVPTPIVPAPAPVAEVVFEPEAIEEPEPEIIEIHALAPPHEEEHEEEASNQDTHQERPVIEENIQADAVDEVDEIAENTAIAAARAALASDVDRVDEAVHTEEITEDEEAAEAAPAFLAGREQRRGFSIFYTVGSALLAFFIALQMALVYRTELITRWPGLRPTLVQLCAGFGCHVTWATRPDLLAVVGTELQVVAGTDVLELSAVIRNRANFKVALPAIEVTLTDTQNRPVARKVFAPVDYLVSSGEPSSRIEEGLSAGSDYNVRIVFEARGLTASGFVVYPFYL